MKPIRAARAALVALAPLLAAATAEAKYLPHADAVHAEALKQQAGTTPLATWNHTYKKGIRTYHWTMVGTDPALGSATTTVPVFIVPMIFTFPKGVVLDPTNPGQKYSFTPLALTEASPIFESFDFKAGTVDLGTTQYIDAFQRANFWSQVTQTSPDYHVLVGQPTVLPSLTVKITATNAVHTGPGGVKIAYVNSTQADNAAINYMKNTPQITPNSFVIFLTYNVLTGPPNNAACGYHSNVGKQTYTVTMFDDNHVCGTVDGDVDTLTHEVAEWTDDPFGNNVTPDKFGILEVGDPASAYGFYVQAPNFKYTLQDLMFHDWFTCSLPSSSANGWFDFMNKFHKNDC